MKISNLMSKGLLGGLALVGLMSTVEPVMASNKDMTGDQIMAEVERRHERPYEYEEQEMTLINKKGAKEKRQVRRFKRQTEDGARYLLTFLSPAGISGVSLLTWQFTEKEDDQWMYLPAMGKKMKRVAKGGKKNYFMGTDYTFEDLASEPKWKFEYTRDKDKKIEGHKVFVVEAVPTEDQLLKSTGYSKQVNYIRQDNFFIIQTDFYSRRGKLIKRRVQKKIEQVDGEMWRSKYSIMQNLKKKHLTGITVKKRIFSEDQVPMKVFSDRYIIAGKQMR